MVVTASYEFRSYLFIFYKISAIADFKKWHLFGTGEHHYFRISTALLIILLAVQRNRATCGLQNPRGKAGTSEAKLSNQMLALH